MSYFKDVSLEELRLLAGRVEGDRWFVEHAATPDGLSCIDDGCQHGMHPITGEAHDIEFAAACVKYVRALLAAARQEGGER